MSLTPIERDDQQAPDEGVERVQTGVLDRVRTVGQWVMERIRSLRGHTERTGPGERPGRGTNLRVADEERTLAVPNQVDAKREEFRERPPTPGEQTGVETERDGKYLRVFDPEATEAYVRSDEWLPVER